MYVMKGYKLPDMHNINLFSEN